MALYIMFVFWLHSKVCFKRQAPLGCFYIVQDNVLFLCQLGATGTQTIYVLYPQISDAPQITSTIHSGTRLSLPFAPLPGACWEMARQHPHSRYLCECWGDFLAVWLFGRLCHKGGTCVASRPCGFSCDGPGLNAGGRCSCTVHTGMFSSPLFRKERSLLWGVKSLLHSPPYFHF